ncbi:hypothetical protein GGI42DRAFT_365240 [Trichoderma sp. SZMC 28013]
MNIVKYLTGLVWRAPECQSQNSQSQNSPILQLPVELLLNIFDFLPPYSRLLVYQTCRAFRAIIHQNFVTGRGVILVTLEHRLIYLTHLARSLPDRWVCAKCCMLHPTSRWDTPSSWWDTPLSWLYRPRCGDGYDWSYDKHSESLNFFNHQLSISHRHIELTLKYTRLNNLKRAHQSHLKRLLTAHHASSIRVAKGIRLKGSFYPKVTYLGVGSNLISQQSIDWIQICPHLAALGTFSLSRDHRMHLGKIIYLAFAAPANTPIFESCSSCGTDFSVQASPKRATVCIWQDLGPEGSVYDPEWAAMVRETTKIYHRPGSIRELYGQHEHNGELLQIVPKPVVF